MNTQLNKSETKKIMLGLASLFLCVPGLLFANGCRKETPAPTKETTEARKKELAEPAKVVLRSSLAGRWYSDNAETLNRQITGFFQKAEVEPKKDVIALVLPHAGYAYSGQTAAFGLKTIEKEYKRIVVIGPSHYVRTEQILSVPRATHYQTPLGEVPLDVEFINKLLEYSLFQNVPQMHEREHSVQIELPLLQYSRKGFKLVPIVTGACSPETIDKAAGILKSLIDSETLLIASSDFVHYGTNYGYVPFRENIPEKIKELDTGAFEHMAGLDSKGFLEYRQRTGATICGYVPVAILLSMLDKPTRVQLIKYETSGRLTGDYTNSVSYLSVSFCGVWEKSAPTEPQRHKPRLTEHDKKQLLNLARKSMLYAIKHRRVPQESDLGITISNAMREPRAAFVTLEKNSALRGCIGDIFPRQPLYKSVIANAVNACINDRRFPPVTIAECDDITIEISALTVPEAIASPQEIRIGIDGVILHKGNRSAVFLPQVAPQQGWDVDTTLRRLSLKAGLGPDAWKEGAGFLTFQAIVFGENEE